MKARPPVPTVVTGVRLSFSSGSGCVCVPGRISIQADGEGDGRYMEEAVGAVVCRWDGDGDVQVRREEIVLRRLSVLG